ncbi:bifunctional molybdenum cofactor biosynthesis protein MoaC/MoaB [candidate division KSB1 bacterium]|nr:bifunctional molybdenum cofactor biosynthesis protein MoaC/MoaB [candidate division KSB1 bacterium]
MIDVSKKFNTLRYARAEGFLFARPEIVQRVIDNNVPKGDVIQVARAAGILAAKKTAELMVFCHPIPLDWVEVTVEPQNDRIRVLAEIRTVWKTGVEMEALTAVSAALLNIYDMLKPLDDDLHLGDIRLVEKSGGWSDYREPEAQNIRCGVLVISDSTFAGQRTDSSGKALVTFLQQQGFRVPVYDVLPDDRGKIESKLTELADSDKLDMIFTAGGSGLGPKDITPEATLAVIDKEIPGIAEALRSYGKDRTPYAMLSRQVCGKRKNTLIINLPGSEKGAMQSIQSLFPGLTHALLMIRGEGH